MPRTGKLFAGIVSELFSGIARGKICTTDGACQFVVDKDILASDLAAGDVTLVKDSEVPRGHKCYVTNYQLRFGNTAFATATDVRLSDNASTPTDFVTVTIANTTGFKHLTSASQTGVTHGSALLQRTGGAAEKGIRLRTTGSAPTAGSDFSIRVEGFFAP
jgi:hypothetical protein